jgi:uncharacterized protein YbaR (Trm112 family)
LIEEVDMALSGDLLAILACPRCKGKLHYRPDLPALDCEVCKLRYRVRDGIPVMLIDEAEKIQ